jgi:hypothetical protein
LAGVVAHPASTITANAPADDIGQRRCCFPSLVIPIFLPL